MAVFREHGGLLPDAGRPAADACRSLPVPRLAGPSGRHHLPARANAVLHLVSYHPCITASSQQDEKCLSLSVSLSHFAYLGV